MLQLCILFYSCTCLNNQSFPLLIGVWKWIYFWKKKEKSIWVFWVKLWRKKEIKVVFEYVFYLTKILNFVMNFLEKLNFKVELKTKYNQTVFLKKKSRKFLCPNNLSYLYFSKILLHTCDQILQKYAFLEDPTCNCH